jgi:hypothetical protein
MLASPARPESARRPDLVAWRSALLFAVPIVALVVYLYYRWFAVRDRYFIFLYYHDMGPGFDTSPFGRVTASRYWMTGLVAGGAVMVLYAAVNFALGRIAKSYRPPDWRRVWALCAVPLLIIVPAIVMTANQPTLPLRNAVQVVVALLAALALAVLPGEVAARRPVGGLLLAVDGLGMAFLLMGLRAGESLRRVTAARGAGMLVYAGLILVFGLGALAVMTAVYRLWRQLRIPDALSLFVAGLSVHYLFLPLLHHLFFSTDEGSWTDPGYFTYISDADNYFARSALYQVGVWIVMALAALGVTRLRRWLRSRGNANSAG